MEIPPPLSFDRIRAWTASGSVARGMIGPAMGKISARVVNFCKSAQNRKFPENFVKLSCFPTKCRNQSRKNLECVEEVHESSNPADSPWSLWKQSTVASGGREESRKNPTPFHLISSLKKRLQTSKPSEKEAPRGQWTVRSATCWSRVESVNVLRSFFEFSSF